MRHTLKFAAALALSVTAVFGSPASAWAAGGSESVEDPIYNVLTAEDPVHTAIAEAALNLERITGITDPSAGK